MWEFSEATRPAEFFNQRILESKHKRFCWLLDQWMAMGSGSGSGSAGGAAALRVLQLTCFLMKSFINSCCCLPAAFIGTKQVINP